jgi:cytochrome c-type protein NapB
MRTEPKRRSHRIAGVAVAALTVAALAWNAAAQQATTQSLRGDVPLTLAAPAPDAAHQNTDPSTLGRAYRQQPPLIPHRIEGYQITTKVNKCMSCHDWPYNIEEQAPKISETHYVDRNGVALDRVSGNRWFCTQCHVPQANARALVDNTFKSAIEVE